MAVTDLFLIRRKGFTLIELMIVIAIIAVLSIIVVTIFNGLQKGARDARRMADIRAIRNALEIYYQKNGKYPYVDTGDSAHPSIYSCTDWSKSNTCPTTALSSTPNWTSLFGGTGAFSSGVAPVDPLNIIDSQNCTYSYVYWQCAEGMNKTIKEPDQTICAWRLEKNWCNSSNSLTPGNDFCLKPVNEITPYPCDPNPSPG